MFPKPIKDIHSKELNLLPLLKGSLQVWLHNRVSLLTIFLLASIPLRLALYGLSHVMSSFWLQVTTALLTNLPSFIITSCTVIIIESYFLGTTLNAKDAFKRVLPKLGIVFVAFLLERLVIGIGLALLIVPGVVAMMCLFFTYPAVVLRDQKGFGALKYSYNLSKDHLASLFMKHLGIFGISIGIGLLSTLIAWKPSPVTHIFSRVVFDVLISYPIVAIMIMYLNLDYMRHSFPGEIPEDDVSEIANMSSLEASTNNPGSLQDIERKAKISKKTNAKTQSTLLTKSKFLRDLSQKFLRDKKEKTLEDLLGLLHDNPQDMRVKQKVAETYYKLSRVDEAANTYLEIARHFENENFYLKAIQAFKNILKIKPNLLEINLKLAELYLKIDMPQEAANQYRIAVTAYAIMGFKEKALEISEKLVKVDPSQENQTKLAEIYQMNDMKDEALKQYENLARQYRVNKDYAKLLHIYELILPHKPNNRAILKDICILYLRNKNPNRALQIIDQYNMQNDDTFKELAEKSHLMIEVLKRQKAS